MKKFCLLLCAAVFTAQAAAGFDFEWKKFHMDASRTGVSVTSVDNVPEALGTVEKGVYTAPNGRKFKGGVTPEVARLLIEVQPAMAEVKTVVGYSTSEMRRHRPESELSNMIVDCMMARAEKELGRKVDVGITNFGGIRVDMPQGDVLLDDVMSMLPFKNYLCYLEVKGKDLRYMFKKMAQGKVEVIGGARLVMKNHQLVSATIGGRPIDDNKVYGVATIDFLLDGGDNVSVARNALSLTKTDVLIFDALMGYLQELKAEGKPIEYKTDGRVVIQK